MISRNYILKITLLSNNTAWESGLGYNKDLLIKEFPCYGAFSTGATIGNVKCDI